MEAIPGMFANIFRLILATGCVLWGLIALKVGYFRYLVGIDPQAGAALAFFCCGLAYFVAGYLFVFYSGQARIYSGNIPLNYTRLAAAIYCGIPLVAVFILRHVGSATHQLYEDGFAYGPLLISLALAMNLHRSGANDRKAVASRIFRILLGVVVAIILFVVYMVLQALSGLAKIG
jgi:hypothetical protein